MQDNSLVRVLVVEDEPLILMLVVDMLHDLGFDIAGLASTIEDAISSARVLRPDVVLLDLNLRGEMSYEVARHCTLEGVPLVLTTGYAAREVPAEFSHCPLVGKPFDTEALGAAIQLALRGRSPCDAPA